MAMLVQIICLLLIIALGYFLVKKFQKPFTTRMIILIAFFAVLKVLLQLLSFVVPLFGVPSLRIGISQLPLMLGGVILGPLGAFVLGIVVDILGLIMNPTNYPFLGFTLSNILVAVLPSLIYLKFKDSDNIDKWFKGIVAGLWGLTIFLLFIFNKIEIGKLVIELNLSKRLLGIVFSGGLFLLILIGAYFIKRINKLDKGLYSLWVLCVVVIELFVNACLTPIWLEVMYGIPFFASFVIRIIKIAFMVNIEGFLGYFVFQALRNFINSEN